MSIEQKLKDEFKQHNKNIVCPSSIDLRVNNLYRERLMEKRGEHLMRRNKKWSKVALVVLIITVLSGFAFAGRTLLFEESKGNLTISAEALQGVDLSETQLESIRKARKEVNAQLNVGESAVVYLSALDNVSSLPIIPMIQPDLNNNLNSWRSELLEHHFNVLPPDSLLGSYVFAGGMKKYPFGTLEGSESDMKALAQELKTGRESSGKEFSWKKIDSTSSLPLTTYTSVYRNNNQDTLYYLIQQIAPDSKIRLNMLTPSSTTYEELDLNGHTARYFKNNTFVFTDSQAYQEISWMTEEEGQATIYTIGSDSPEMTKEQLIEAANQL